MLNALLAGGHGLRIGVLVNDFGSVSIDEKLIVSRDGEVVTLANGCACCSVAGDLGAALDRLARAKIPPEHIVVEASGVADPARIAAMACSPGLEPRATVVLVDAETVVARSRDKFVGRLVRKQMAAAGLIVLNKIDLATAAGSERLRDARSLVAAEAPRALVIETSLGRVEPALLLAERGPRPSIFACEAPEDDAGATFESFRWTAQSPVNLQALADTLARLPASVVRAKGVLRGPDGRAFEAQRVGERVNVSPMPGAELSIGADMAFVALAGTLDRDRLAAALRACLL
jgi:G3E family GTPase